MGQKWEAVRHGGKDEVLILRNPVEGRCTLSDVVRGVEKLDSVGELCSKRGLDETFVQNTPVLIDASREFYMYIDDERKTLVACRQHISDSDLNTVYLDFVHELVHIFQLYDGRELFDRTVSYVERPTEIEAYDITVREGRRLGMTDAELFEYLNVGWISGEEHLKLAKTMGLSL